MAFVCSLLGIDSSIEPQIPHPLIDLISLWDHWSTLRLQNPFPYIKLREIWHPGVKPDFSK